MITTEDERRPYETVRRWIIFVEPPAYEQASAYVVDV